MMLALTFTLGVFVLLILAVYGVLLLLGFEEE
jgi:hypothetical protein